MQHDVGLVRLPLLAERHDEPGHAPREGTVVLEDVARRDGSSVELPGAVELLPGFFAGDEQRGAVYDDSGKARIERVHALIVP